MFNSKETDLVPVYKFNYKARMIVVESRKTWRPVGDLQETWGLNHGSKHDSNARMIWH